MAIWSDQFATGESGESENLHFSLEKVETDHICMSRWKGRDVSLSKRIKAGIIIAAYGKAWGV